MYVYHIMIEIPTLSVSYRPGGCQHCGP